MVWIHGGAFLVGSGATRLQRPRLAERGDVVVVTPNYRLGALGFAHLGLAHNGPLPEHESGHPRSDRRARLGADNIAAFGGDPGSSRCSDSRPAHEHRRAAHSPQRAEAVPTRDRAERRLRPRAPVRSRERDRRPVSPRSDNPGPDTCCAAGRVACCARSASASTPNATTESPMSSCRPWTASSFPSSRSRRCDRAPRPSRPADRRDLRRVEAVRRGRSGDWSAWAGDLERAARAALPHLHASAPTPKRAASELREALAQRGGAAEPRMHGSRSSRRACSSAGCAARGGAARGRRRAYAYLLPGAPPPRRSARRLSRDRAAVRVRHRSASARASAHRPVTKASGSRARSRTPGCASRAPAIRRHSGLPSWPSYEPRLRATMLFSRDAACSTTPLEPDRRLFDSWSVGPGSA